nr:DUF4418 family protein [Gordonibacter massiliensis (ex Traore et al. 2017)]
MRQSGNRPGAPPVYPRNRPALHCRPKNAEFASKTRFWADSVPPLHAEGRRFAAVASIATAVVAVLLTTPAGIGLCGSADMHCHQTALSLWIAAGAAIVVGIVQLAKADPKAAELPKMQL